MNSCPSLHTPLPAPARPQLLQSLHSCLLRTFQDLDKSEISNNALIQCKLVPNLQMPAVIIGFALGLFGCQFGLVETGAARALLASTRSRGGTWEHLPHWIGLDWTETGMGAPVQEMQRGRGRFNQSLLTCARSQSPYAPPVQIPLALHRMAVKELGQNRYWEDHLKGSSIKKKCISSQRAQHFMIMTTFRIIFEHIFLHLHQNKLPAYKNPTSPSYREPLLSYTSTPTLLEFTIVSHARVGVALQESRGHPIGR